MNERYLFRGKRLDNGEWRIGDLAHLPDGICIFVPEVSIIGNYDKCKVDPATVGRCTGLRDKNGKLIFEGDIIRTSRAFEVKWIDKDARFICVSAFSWNIQQQKYTRGNGNTICYLSDNTFEIIGNKWDNPELLQEETR